MRSSRWQAQGNVYLGFGSQGDDGPYHGYVYSYDAATLQLKAVHCTTPDWGEGGILNLFTGVTTELKPGMTFHLPVALRIYGQFTVGVSETVVVTETGCKPLSAVDRALQRIAA